MPELDDRAYAERLAASQQAPWKRVLRVQAPYGWLVRRLALGRVLEVGCGIGRNLEHLGPRAVGVDVNAVSVAIANERGHAAFDADAVARGDVDLGRFDTLLASHVLEHVGRRGAPELLAAYLPLLRPSARLVLITPQEAGFRTDPTHVELLGFDELADVASALGFAVSTRRSFPFPRAVGRVFPYNEFVVVADR